MKKIVLFFALFLISNFYRSQLTYQWANSSGSSLSEYGQAIASDPSGNVYVTGSFSGTVDFDPSASTATLSGLSGSQDIFLAKYSSTGSFIWVKQIAGTNTEKPFDLVVDASGAYLAGIFIGTVDFDPNAGTNNITFLGGGTDGDGFFAKYDVNGNLVWVDRIGSTANDRVIGIAIDASQNVFISGFIGGNADMDPSAASASLNVTGTYNAYFAKYTSTGAYVFAKQITGGYSEGDDIALDGSGNIYLTGSYATTNDFDPGAGTANLSTSSLTQLDIYLAKYTSAGAYTYAKQIGGIGVDIGFQVVPDALGNVYLGGVFSSTCDFDPTAAVSNLTSAGQGDLFVAKYDASGNLTWKNGTGGTNNDYCYGLGLDASNNVYITGNFQGTAIDFDPSASIAALTASSSCLYIASYSSAGNYLSASSPGNIASDGKGLVVNSSVYVTGMFANTGDFDFSATTANLTGIGGSDIFFAKYNVCAGSPPVQPSAIAGSFTVCNGTSHTYSVTNDPLATSYTWTFPIGWTGTSTTNVTVPTVSTSGIISVVASNSCGASPSQTLNIAVGNPIAGISSFTNPSCFGGNNAVATVTTSGGIAGPGFPTYNWSNGQNTSTATNLLMGVYTVTITDAVGCVATTSVTITQPAILTVNTFSGTTNCSQANGTISCTASGGAGGYTYLWSAGPSYTNAVVNNVVQGSYTVTVKDANNCTQQAIANINDIAGPTIIVTYTSPANCYGGAPGSAAVSASGGVGPLNYMWSYLSQTTQNVNNLPAGSYTVTVTDQANCSSFATLSITQPSSAVAASFIAFNGVSCFGGSNGGATILASGGNPGYTYFWTPSAQTGSALVNASGGNYTCTTTDASGCFVNSTINIFQPTALLLSVSSVTNVSCSGNFNGAAQIIASGGTPNYNYLWSPSAQTNSVLTGVPSGIYTCSVTDVSGCVNTKTVNITQPPILIITTNTVSNPTCNGFANGQIATSISGGNPSYSITWTPSLPSTATVTNLPAGSYSLQVIDIKGCSTFSVYTIVDPPALVIQQSNTTTACGGSNGSATVIVQGGAPGYSYSWSPTAQTTNIITGLTNGNYTLTTTDANGCVIINTVSIPFGSIPNVQVTQSAFTICAGQTFTMNAVGASIYNWSPCTPSVMSICIGPTVIAMPPTTTQYTVTGLIASGCSGSAVVVVTVNPSPLVTAVSNTSLICAGQTATLTANGANTYTWSTIATGSNIAVSPTVTTTYAVNGTGINGCSNTFAITQSVSLCTSINNNSNNNDILKIYPNPFSNEIVLEINNFKEEIGVNIYNSLGQLVFKTKLEQATSTLNLSELPSGIYIMESDNKEGKKLLKLIKD